MESKAHQSAEPLRWTIHAAEALITSLKGVVSARLVCRPGGEVEEIHVLTNRAVNPKQTVRNIESALRARFDMVIDHRKISVAQSSDNELAGWENGHPAEPSGSSSQKPGARLEAVQGGRTAEGTPGGSEAHPPKSASDLEPGPAPAMGEGVPALGAPGGIPSMTRLRLMGHKVHREGGHRLRIQVELAWQGKSYTGESRGLDLPRIKLESLAKATLKAMGKVLEARGAPGEEAPSLALDGVKVVEAFDRSYVLVAVHALHSRGISPLSGSAPVDDGVERAVVQATLQAADRWVRGQSQAKEKPE